MKTRKFAFVFACTLGVAALASTPSPVTAACAGDSKEWPVKGRLLGKDIKDNKKAKDVSGIACATSRGFP